MSLARIPAWLGLCLALVGANANALDRGRQVMITDPVQAETLLATVENALWAADGNKADKPVYVIYSTECAYSKKLFQDTRGLGDRVQLRWIAAAARGADQVVSKRDGATIAAAFAGTAGAPADPGFGERGVAYNLATMNSTHGQLRQFGGGNSFAFPTLIYRTEQGVRVIAGNPADLSQLEREAISQPDRAELRPAALDLVREPVTAVRRPSLTVFTNHGNVPVPVRALPDDRAPMLDQLTTGYQLPASGVVPGSPWIEVEPWGPQGPKAYVNAPLEAKLAMLDFQVRPVGGHVVAETRDLEIRSHPVSDAPIIDTLPQGYQVRKSGEVQVDGRIWDEVLPFTDNTKGYVLR
ncbi:MAG TPA: hypothetical protein VF210_03470 [Pseudomonadales bacterium]